MDSPWITYAPIIFIAFIVLLAIIIIPTVLRKTRKAQKKSADFLPDLCRRTGLTPTSDGAQGTYKGYRIHFRSNMGANYALMAEAWLTDSTDSIYGRQTFYPIVHIELQSDGDQFPQIALYQKMPLLRHHQKIMDFLNDRDPDDPEMSIDASPLHRKAKFYGTDNTAAQRLLASGELKQLLSTWYYPDVRSGGNGVTLQLNNNNVLNKFGRRLSDPGYIVQAIDICVAYANALK